MLDVKVPKKYSQLCILNLPDSPEPLKRSVFLLVLMGSHKEESDFR